MRRRGFTILEVALVAVVLLLLAAMIVPSMDTMYGELRLNAAADLVRARWADARAHAIEEGTPYRFEVVPGTGRFRVAPESEEAAAANNPVEELLPEGVIFAVADNATPSDEANGEFMPIATFLPDASAKEDVTIKFEARHCRPMIVSLRALTGAVHVEYETAGTQ